MTDKYTFFMAQLTNSSLIYLNCNINYWFLQKKKNTRWQHFWHTLFYYYFTTLYFFVYKLESPSHIRIQNHKIILKEIFFWTVNMFLTRSEYDRSVNTFSPEGRLFQVEYAIEAIKLGSTAIGIQTSEGTVLAVEKRITSPLMVPRYIQ